MSFTRVLPMRLPSTPLTEMMALERTANRYRQQFKQQITSPMVLHGDVTFVLDQRGGGDEGLRVALRPNGEVRLKDERHISAPFSPWAVMLRWHRCLGMAQLEIDMVKRGADSVIVTPYDAHDDWQIGITGELSDDVQPRNVLTNRDNTMLAMAIVDGVTNLDEWLEDKLTVDTAHDNSIMGTIRHIEKILGEYGEDTIGVEELARSWLGCIYSNGGYHRWFVDYKGKVAFSQHHTISDKYVDRAEEMGFDIN
jgi:hypothetical protein